MVKQRRSFFVDDILHMIMPTNKNTNRSNEINDRKRKRSITHDGDSKEEDDTIENNVLNKKFRLNNNEDEDDNGESKDSQLLNTSGGDGGGTGEDSSTDDDSNSVDHFSGKLIFKLFLTSKYQIQQKTKNLL